MGRPTINKYCDPLSLEDPSYPESTKLGHSTDGCYNNLLNPYMLAHCLFIFFLVCVFLFLLGHLHVLNMSNVVFLLTIWKEFYVVNLPISHASMTWIQRFLTSVEELLPYQFYFCSFIKFSLTLFPNYLISPSWRKWWSWSQRFLWSCSLQISSLSNHIL